MWVQIGLVLTPLGPSDTKSYLTQMPGPRAELSATLCPELQQEREFPKGNTSISKTPIPNTPPHRRSTPDGDMPGNTD